MSLTLRRVLQGTLGTALLVLAQACVVPDGGYSEGVGVSYEGDFYEPYGYEYGGWGPGYRIGPPRGGERRPGGHVGRGGHPTYHPAPSSRPMPSIPTHSRGPSGGGARGGGGRGGGGRH